MTPDLNRILGLNLRRLRETLQLSQEEFADRCGLHRTYVGAIERGERNVTLKTLRNLADALDTSAIELLRARR